MTAPEPTDFDPIAHEITVAQLKTLLGQLRDDDVLVPNMVRNLAIVRAGTQIGYVDLLRDRQKVELL